MHALLNQSLGARARGIDVGFGVGIHQLDVDAEQVANYRRRKIGAFLTGLADQALQSRLRQEHADLELHRLGVDDIKWRERGGARRQKIFVELPTIHFVSV